MPDRVKFASWCMLMLLLASQVLPIAKADAWDKETTVTFNSPVEVPGQVLAPGTYVFKLADTQSDRQIVQIFTQDHAKLLATILTIPDYRVVAAEKPVISFEERPSGKPEAVGSWFYPGDNHGFRFVYPKSAMQLADNTEAATSPAPATTEATTAPVPPAEAVTSPADASVAQEQIGEIVAQNTPMPVMQRGPVTLPKTAGNFLAIPLAGFGLLVAGATMLVNAPGRR